MARKRKKKRSGKKGLDPSEVLSGSVHPTVEQLVELIARINPTGSSLPPGEVRRRYEHKSALQSLLINRHSDELSVEPDPEQENVVVLRHRYGHRDACHAVIDELDVDARAWVRLQLDTFEQDTESPTIRKQEKKRGHIRPKEQDSDLAPADETDPNVLLERGRRAIEEYDYEEARSCLETALERTGGALEAAIPLLELLVDHLGLYDEALDLPGRLLSSVRSDPEVRSLLALAAGRAGRIPEAERWAKNLGSIRAGEVYLVLSGAAEKKGELKKATEHLKKSRSLGFDPTEILNREKSLHDRQAELHGHDEAVIESLLEDGDVETAARKARELLEAWPNSLVARRAVRESEDHKRIDRLQECLSKAEKSLIGRNLAEGVKLLKRALELGGNAGEIEPRIAEAEEELRKQAEARELERVDSLLRADDRIPGLLAYLSLDESQRGRVRGQSDMSILDWLEEMGASRLAARLRPGASEAVLALEHALVELDGGRIETAAKLVQQHKNLLGGVKDASRVMSAFREKEEEDRRKQAGESLCRLCEALNYGDLASARSAASSMNSGLLSESERSEAERLMAGLGEKEETLRLKDAFEARKEEGDLLAARATARELADRTAGDDRTSWIKIVEELNRRIKQEWNVHVIEEWDQDVVCPDEQPLLFLHDVTTVWLTPDGKDLVYATSFGGWLFIRVIEVSTSKVKSAVSLRTLEPMEQYLDVLVHEDIVWIADSTGRLLGLDRNTWDIRSWHDVRKLLPGNETLDHVFPLPSERFVWAETSTGLGDCVVRVLDMENWRVHREVKDIMWTKLLAPGEPHRIVCGRREGAFVVVNIGGSTKQPGRIPRTGQIKAVSVHPDGERLIVLAVGDSWVGEEEDFARLRVLDSGGSLSEPAELPDTFEDGRQDMVTSRNIGATYAVLETTDGEHKLLAFRPEGDSLGDIYSIDLPKSYRLVGDSRANHATLLLRGLEGPLIIPLGLQLPEISSVDDTEHHLGSLSISLMHCKWTEELADDETVNVPKRFRVLKPEAREKKVDELWKKHMDEPEKLLTAVRKLGYANNKPAKRLARMAIRRHPDEMTLLLQLAHMEAEDEHWEEVGRLLSDRDPDRLGPACKAHWLHILGMARYFGGEIQPAIDLWNKALSEGGAEHCELKEMMIQLLEDLPDSIRPEDWDENKPLAHRLRGRIKAADEAMERGDQSEALRIIDRPVVWRVAEVQSLARLASVLLETKSNSPSERYKMSVALALFIQEQGNRDSRFDRRIPLSEGQWDQRRLDELRDRCREWLERWARSNRKT